MAPASEAPPVRVRANTPTDVSAAIAARRRRERQRHLLTVAILSAIALLLAGVVWLVGYSSVLASKRVEVVGAKTIPASQITTVANVAMGVPLTRFDTRAVADRVAALPGVDEVSVRTQWPNTVLIEVSERQAVFQRQQGVVWQFVDSDGVTFHNVQQRDKALPVVTSPSVDNELLSEAATVVSHLTPALRSKLAEVQATSHDQIVVVLTSGQKIIWGDAEQSEVKAQVAQALVAKAKFSELNVSSPGNPTSR